LHVDGETREDMAEKQLWQCYGEKLNFEGRGNIREVLKAHSF